MCSLWDNKTLRGAICLLVLLAVGGVYTSVSAQTQGFKNTDRVEMKGEPVTEVLPYVPHQLVVRLNTEMSSGAADPFGLEFVQSVQSSLTLAPIYLVMIDNSLDELAAAAEMEQSAAVAYAQPNYRLNSAFPIQGSYPFSDERFVGSIPGQYAADLLGLPAAHQIASGTGITVAVIDGGVDFAHSGVGGAAVSGHDFIDGDENATDPPGGKASGHGTFVAGLIHLTAPQATIKSYRVMTPNGDGDGFTLARAIEQAVLDGCKVINLSLALTGRHQAVRDAIDYAVSQGTLVIAGAGNGGSSEPVYPAAEENAIAVAAVDSTMHAASFTSFGSYVDVAAPGSMTYSAFQGSLNAWWSGTSFSAPFVSGLAALIMQAQPTSHWLHVRDAILLGARDIDTLNPALNGELGYGLIDPMTSLTFANNDETAAVIPDSLHFMHYEGAMYAVIPSMSAMLVSSNAPAPYTAEVRSGSGPIGFAHPKDEAGMTGDTVIIYCNPGPSLTPGDYADTILYHVDGVSDPAKLVVGLTVVPFGDTVGVAYVTPGSLWFTARQNTEPLLMQKAFIWSYNAPANFTGTLMPGGDGFVTDFTATGATNDTIQVTVSPSLKPNPGLYVDSLEYTIEGADQPVQLLVYLQITDSNSVTDSAWLVNDTSTIEPLVVEEGSLGMYMGCRFVYSTNAPATYTVSTLGTSSFIGLTTTSGQTNSLFCYGIGVGSLAPGAYVDTLLFDVAGVANSPLLSTVTLIVTPQGGGGGGSDSVVVTPQAHSFLAITGIGSTQFGLSTVINAAGPTAYTVSYLDTPDFTELLNASGTTPDSIRFKVTTTSGTPAGVYKDSLIVNVSGVATPFLIVNTLTVGNGEPGEATAFASPSEIYVGSSGTVTDTIYRPLTLVSSNAPTAYTATLLDAPSEFVFLPKTSGWTNDSLVIGILPNSLADGMYEDSVSFSVAGVTNPVLVVVRLTVGDTSFPAPSAVVAHQNYPNPFNPSTSILFSLDRPARVTLEIYNMLGQQVATLAVEEMGTGSHTVIWEGTDDSGTEVSSGIYFYRLTADGAMVSRKMLLIK